MGNPAAELKYISRSFAHGHTCLDMISPEGSPIHAAAGGTVVYAWAYFASGKIVDLQYADGVVVTRYAHRQAFAPGIALGTPVSAGEPIGKVGHTGRAEGSHVHLDVRIAGRPVDPRHLAPCTGVTDASPIDEAEVPAPRVRRRPQRKAQH